MYKKFICAFLGISGALLLLAGGFNIAVDPYNVWRIYQRVGFNAWSPKAEDLDRLIQPIAFVPAQPEAVFLGTSQVIWGIEASEYTRLTGKSAYNMGMLGSSIYEIRRSLEHAVAVDGNLREVFVCVNFELFAANARHPLAQKKPEFDESQIGCSHMTGENIARTAFSFKALEDSLATIRENRQHRYDFSYYMPTGRWQDKSIEKYCQNRQWQFNASMVIMARNDYYYEDMELDEDCLGEMQRIIDICREHDLALHVYTLPAHARSMQLYAEAWPVYEAWMHRLVQMVPVLDFAGYNEMTMSEAQPGLLSESSNPYFWDSHHAKAAVGDMVLAVLAGTPEARAGFGTLLTPETVDQKLASLRAGRALWEQAHPESVEEVRYYRGFSPLVPQAVQAAGREALQGVARLDRDTGAERLRLKVSRGERLDLTGEHLTPAGQLRIMYGLLDNGQGQCYYAMAEPVSNPALAGFMHDKTYEGSGFHIQEPLREVEPGDYGLYLLEVAQDGRVYRSGLLAQLTVQP